MFRRRGVIISGVSTTKRYKHQYISVGGTGACTAVYLRILEDETSVPKHVKFLKQIYVLSSYLCFRLLFVLFHVLFVCKCVLPLGDNAIAVNKYIISYCVHLLVNVILA
jgi:hypothetical protein